MSTKPDQAQTRLCVYNEIVSAAACVTVTSRALGFALRPSTGLTDGMRAELSKLLTERREKLDDVDQIDHRIENYRRATSPRGYRAEFLETN